MSEEDNMTEDLQESIPEVTPDEVPKVVPHKKSKKKLVGIIIACVVVALIAGAAVFAAPTVYEVFSNKSLSTGEKFKTVVADLKDKVTNKKLPPDQRLQKVVTNLKDDLTSQYDKAETFTQDDLSNLSSNGTFSIKLGDSLMSMLPEEYAILSDISGKFTSNVKDSSQATTLSLDVAGKQIVSLNAISKDNSKYYIQVPELSNDYLVLDLATSGISIPDNKELIQKLTDKESIKSFINSTFDTFNNYITDVTIKENVKVTVKDIDCIYDQLTLTLSGAQLKELSKELTTTLSKEPIMTSMIEYMKTFYEQTGTSIPEISLDELLKEIDSSEIPDDMKFTCDFYLNRKNEFKGFYISSPEGEEDTAELSLMLANDDEDTKVAVFTCKNDDQIVFDVVNEYAKKDGAYNGSLTATTYTDGVAGDDFTVEFSDLLVENQTFKGTFECTLSALKGGKIIFTIDSNKDGGNVSLGVTMAGSPMLDLSYEAKIGHEAVIPEIDASADTYDVATGLNDYLNASDMLGFIQNITDVTGIDIMSLINNY